MEQKGKVIGGTVGLLAGREMQRAGQAKGWNEWLVGWWVGWSLCEAVLQFIRADE